MGGKYRYIIIIMVRNVHRTDTVVIRRLASTDSYIYFL